MPLASIPRASETATFEQPSRSTPVTATRSTPPVSATVLRGLSNSTNRLSLATRFDNVDRYISSDRCTQHNKDVADGLEAFRELALTKDRPLVYEEIVLLVGQGNFVATLCRARWKDIPYAQADLFRLENGFIVEHWDAAEPIGPPDTWVNSGKF